MEAIWKFPLSIGDSETISMPTGAKVLCVQVRGATPCIWAIVDTKARTEERTFATYRTGHEHIAIAGNFIGTYRLYGGGLVFHVFEEGK